MRSIVSDQSKVAYCGLYCGACKRYLKDKCPGCHENQKAGWCKVRSCNMQHEYLSCADCSQFQDPDACKYFNNFISRMFALVFRSNRNACIQQIRELGLQGHADKMAELGIQTLKR